MQATEMQAARTRTCVDSSLFAFPQAHRARPAMRTLEQKAGAWSFTNRYAEGANWGVMPMKLTRIGRCTLTVRINRTPNARPPMNIWPSLTGQRNLSKRSSPDWSEVHPAVWSARGRFADVRASKILFLQHFILERTCAEHLAFHSRCHD